MLENFLKQQTSARVFTPILTQIVLSPMGRSTTITASCDFLKFLDLGSGAVPGAGSIGGRDSL